MDSNSVRGERMTTLSKTQIIKRPFADKKHYPYGFARSGDFSISESKLLQAHGSLFAALVDGKVTPESEQEQGYLDAALGVSIPNTPEEKAWVKYQNRINRPKMASIYGAKRPAIEEVDGDDDISDNTDLDIELDND